MKPHLVRARISDLGPHPDGAIILYVAMFESERDALDAVKAIVPLTHKVIDVVGIAADSVVERRKLTAEQIEML